MLIFTSEIYTWSVSFDKQTFLSNDNIETSTNSKLLGIESSRDLADNDKIKKKIDIKIELKLEQKSKKNEENKNKNAKSGESIEKNNEFNLITNKNTDYENLPYEIMKIVDIF